MEKEQLNYQPDPSGRTWLIEVGFGRISRTASSKEQAEQNAAAYRQMGFSPIHITEFGPKIC